MARGSNGQYRVSPLHLAECEGVGTTLKEATEAAYAALLNYLKMRRDDFIFPPMDTLDPEELAQGKAIRIDIQLQE